MLFSDNKKYVRVDNSKPVSIYNENGVNKNFIHVISKLNLNCNLIDPNSFFGTRLSKGDGYDYLTSNICLNPGSLLNTGLIALKEFDDSIDIYGGVLDTHFYIQTNIIEVYNTKSVICFKAKPNKISRIRMLRDGTIKPFIPSSKYVNTSNFEQIEIGLWAYQTDFGPIISFDDKIDPYFLWDRIRYYWNID